MQLIRRENVKARSRRWSQKLFLFAALVSAFGIAIVCTPTACAEKYRVQQWQAIEGSSDQASDFSGQWATWRHLGLRGLLKPSR
jgi:hypothetical protein